MLSRTGSISRVSVCKKVAVDRQLRNTDLHEPHLLRERVEYKQEQPVQPGKPRWLPRIPNIVACQILGCHVGGQDRVFSIERPGWPIPLVLVSSVVVQWCYTQLQQLLLNCRDEREGQNCTGIGSHSDFFWIPITL